MTQRMIVALGGAALTGIVALSIRAEDGGATSATPQELGTISWRRGFDAAAAESKRSGRPLLILFQEVPGCGTCKSYGDLVLSHPLIRDAAESLFVPVAVYNNIPGDDETTLKSFKEPAWNNPVVRITRHDRGELATRVAGDYSVAGLVSAMVTALEKEKRDVPAYLRLLNDASMARKRGLERATFAMHCFWEGEGQLGGLAGVVETAPGFVKGREVVDVWYDGRALSFANLVAEARKVRCASVVFSRTDQQQAACASIKGLDAIRTDDKTRPDSEPKYYLSKSPYRFVPMTPTQAARINAALHGRRNPDEFLCPSQLALLAKVKAQPDAGWENAIGEADLGKAFAAAQRISERTTKRR